MTLLEVLLVLAILAIMAGLSVPLLNSYLRQEELRRNVTELRTLAASTRIKSLDTGLIYQFRFEPEGRWFVILPYEPAGQAYLSAAAETGTMEATLRCVSGQLSEGCRFEIPVMLATGVTEQLPQDWLDLLPDGNELQMVDWSPALLFYPDGSAEDAAFTIVDDEESRVTLTIRGLTGDVSTGPILKGERR